MVWTANPEVQNKVPGFNGDLDVFLRVCRDAGRTWSDRVVLSDETVKANQYEPGIAIAPDGTVHVAWYDFKHSPTKPLVSTGHSGDTGISDVYATSSTDHGATFAPPIRATTGASTGRRACGRTTSTSKFNVGVAATSDAVFFTWQNIRRSPSPRRPPPSPTAGFPGWTLLLTGLFGLGLGVVVAWLLFRRRGDEPESVPRGTPVRA